MRTPSNTEFSNEYELSLIAKPVLSHVKSSSSTWTGEGRNKNTLSLGSVVKVGSWHVLGVTAAKAAYGVVKTTLWFELIDLQAWDC